MQDNVSDIHGLEGNVTAVLKFVFKPPSPINRDLWFIILKLILSSTGIPFNLLMAFVILRLRRFRCKPRNIFLLGISVSDLIACIPPMIEVVDYFFLLPPENAIQRTGTSLVNCQIFVWMRGLPETFLLLNTFFSLIDKLISIRYHMWHKDKVTVSRVTLGLVCTFVSSGTLMRLHFISGLVPLRCRGDFWTGFTTGVVLLTLFILCLVSHILVYIQSRKLLYQLNPIEKSAGNPDEYEMIEMNTFPTTRQPAASDNVCTPADEVEEGNKSKSKAKNQQQHRRLRRLEEKSTKTLLIEVTSLLLIFFPTAVYIFSTNLCRLIATNADYSCNSYVWLNNYFKQSGLVHSVYHPVVYLVLQKEEFSIVFFKKKSISIHNKRRTRFNVRRS